MDPTDLSAALDCLALRGASLRDRFHYDWPRQAREAVSALRYHIHVRQTGPHSGPYAAGPHSGPYTDHEPCANGDRELSLVAIVGGASSGKSTVFNNLLGGRLASRVTAKGHATLGPIAAVHESRREEIEQTLASGLFWPSFTVRVGSLDDKTPGEPGVLHLVYHQFDSLRGVVLFDMPDFTSELARLEGDIAHETLPWFDRLIVIVDHERWFDRQTIGRLRDESSRFGQERFVVFNRDQEGHLDEPQLARLRQQAERLGASDQLILEFRRGRGCCTFPPGTFDRLTEHLGGTVPDRQSALVHDLGRLAGKIASNNEERRARLNQLREALDRAVDRGVPSRTECFAALLTAEERRHLEVIARTLRIAETRQWLARNVQRARDSLRRRLPLLGILPARDAARDERPPADAADRPTIGWEVYRARCLRLLGEVDSAATDSDFWIEVRRWTAVEPPRSAPDSIERQRDAVRAVVARMDEAIRAWTAKVESECRGVSPWLVGAVGAGTLAAAILLAAVAGPITALTWPIITAKLTGALGTLAAGAGAGAVAGRSVGRFLAIVRERLIGGPEFAAVQEVMDEYRESIVTAGRDAASTSYAAAQAMVIPESDDLAKALAALFDAAEGEG